MDQPFEHVVIVGCGLLGASLGMAMGKLRMAHLRTGVGRSGSASAGIALCRGAVDRICEDLSEAVSGGEMGVGGGNEAEGGALVPPADLVVLCTPLGQFPGILERLGPVVPAGAIVTDVGSVKGEVMRWAARMLPAQVRFVGSHPMAGSEQSGPEAANAELFGDAACIVCPAQESGGGAAGAQEKATERVAGMWRGLGMRVSVLSPEEHDRRVAAISHLPHVLAALLVNTAAAEPGALELAAGGFLDTTRIAAGDVTMWTDILLTNREAALAALDGLGGAMAGMRAAIAGGDEKAIRQALASAREVRRKMVDRRPGRE